MDVGIIGFGDGGKENFKGLADAGARVLAVCDIDQKKFSSEIYKNIYFYKNFEDLINRKDIDLIIVATPDNKHFQSIELALKAGKMVFVEKPLVTTAEEIRKIEKLVLQYPNKLFYSEKYSFTAAAEALLYNRETLGDYLYGTTFYTMGFSDKIMGNGKWRTECAYNPCAGGLSHNFMVSLLISGSNIRRVRASGRVLTYGKNLNKYGGYDFMEGTLEFGSGAILNWIVDLSRNNGSLFGHRTISHFFKFKNGLLAYSPNPGSDILKINGNSIDMKQEPDIKEWKDYNNQLYVKMYEDVFATIEKNVLPRHSIIQGINVAKTCIYAYDSAQKNGEWINVD